MNILACYNTDFVVNTKFTLMEYFSVHTVNTADILLHIIIISLQSYTIDLQIPVVGRKVINHVSVKDAS